MWHVLKFDYESPPGAGTRTKLIGYSNLAEAQTVFDHLELGFQFNQPIRLTGGKMAKVKGACLYESFKNNLQDAEAEVLAGDATLMDKAREIEIDLGP